MMLDRVSIKMARKHLSTILVAVEFMSFEDKRIFKFCGTMIVIR